MANLRGLDALGADLLVGRILVPEQYTRIFRVKTADRMTTAV
jgi:hypothetical protein